MRRQPLPKEYWRHIAGCGVLLALVFVQIGLAVVLTEGREIHQFTRTDQIIFAGFVLTMLLTVFFAFCIARDAGRILTAHQRQAFLAHLHEGLDPAAYACILPEMDGDRRALIARTAEGWQLSIDRYDEALCAWQPDRQPPRCFPDRMALLRALEEECDFVADPEDLDLPPQENE